MKYDVKIRSMENIYNAFIFSNLIEKIKKIKKIPLNQKPSAGCNT